MKFLSRLVVISFILAAIAGTVAWFKHTDKNAAAANVSAVPIRVTAVARKDIPLEIREVGNTLAYETVAVRSRLDSQIMKVAFHDGDVVKAGDLLFELDDRNLKAQLGQLEANLNRDRVQLENLRRQFERSKALHAQGYEAGAKLDDARAAFETQRATVGATEAAFESVRVELGYTKITAPISGRTGTIRVTVGNTVKANDTQPLVTINQIQPIRVQASLSQNYFDALRDAMGHGEVIVTALREGSAEEPSVGTLEYIDNAVDQSTGTFAVRAVFPNMDERLWPGMFVTLTLMLGDEKNALTVPEVAVQHGQGGDFVFVIEGEKASKRPVKISRLQDNVAVLTEGVTENEKVAVDGLMSLKDGSAVMINSDGEK